jgi:hypothetical protein
LQVKLLPLRPPLRLQPPGLRQQLALGLPLPSLSSKIQSLRLPLKWELCFHKNPLRALQKKT